MTMVPVVKSFGYLDDIRNNAVFAPARLAATHRHYRQFDLQNNPHELKIAAESRNILCLRLLVDFIEVIAPFQ